MLRCPEPIKMFALYLPSSMLLTLALDLGRGESALRQGMPRSAEKRLYQTMAVLVSATVMVLLVLPFSSFHSRFAAITCLALSGALQTYVDIVLRLCLFRCRRSLYLYLYSLALNSLNAAVAALVVTRFMNPMLGLAFFVLLPTGVVTAFARVLPPPAPSHQGSASLRPSRRLLISALTYRVLPPAMFTAYAAALTRFAPELAASARALYFVFGFIHTRRMTREGTSVDDMRTSARLFALTCLLSVPILLVGGQLSQVTWQSLARSAVVTCCASIGFAWFLRRYTAFLKEAGARPAAMEVAPQHVR